MTEAFSYSFPIYGTGIATLSQVDVNNCYLDSAGNFDLILYDVSQDGVSLPGTIMASANFTNTTTQTCSLSGITGQTAANMTVKLSGAINVGSLLYADLPPNVVYS